MAINKKLISFATQVQFDNQLSAGNIDNRSIVFIEDKKRIWTHGVYFDTLWDYIQNKPSTLDEYGITDAAKKINSLYYVEGNTTGTAGAWTGFVPEITSLYAGLTIAYKIGVAGASTTNLNINGYGNKLVRRNTSNLTTHLPVGTVVLLTYDGTYWVWADYHANTTYAAMSVAEGIAGTVSTLRTMRADYLKQIVEHYIANTVPSAHTLASHSDVTITSNSNGEILRWNGTNWINNTLAEAGISASSHSHSWTQITNKPNTLAGYGIADFTSHKNSNPINVADIAVNAIGYANGISLLGANDGGLLNIAYSSTWQSQIFQDFRTGQIALRGKNNGTWTSWRTVWDSNNLTNLSQLNNNLPNFTRTVAGLVPAPGAATITRYLREDGTWVIPPNTPDTHWVTGVYVGAVTTKTDTTVTNPYIKIFDNDTNRGNVQIIGGTNVTVSSNSSKAITISSSYTDTTYTTGTLAQLNAGTDTTGRLQTAKLLNDWLDPKLNSKFDKTGGRLTTGTGDVNIELWRGANASWNILNSGGYLRFQSNYTTVAGAYFDTLKLDYNTGNALFKGTVTAPTFSGALSGNATTATTATNLNRSIIAGNGLSGGGVMTADRTITLGTPGTLTATSTNSVTSTSHTHSIDSTNFSVLDANRLNVPDTRSVNDAPSGIPNKSITAFFKTASVVQSPPVSTGSSYAHILNMNGYNSGNSGGGGHTTQLAFGDSLAIRQSTSTSAWGDWTRLALVTDNVASATKLETARTIAGVSFDGSKNISIPFANLSNRPGTLAGYGVLATDTMLTAKNASLITSTTTTGITNVATNNTNTYLNIVQGGLVSSSIKVTGTGSVTLSSATNGAITIHGSENITYLSGTKELIQLGIDTTNRVWSGKTLKDWYLEEIDILLDSDRFTGSTFSSNVIDLTNVNGAFNVNSANNYTTYTLSNKKVRGAWARVLVNSSIPITVTGVKLINLGSNFELNTNMYLNVMYDGINTLGYYTKVAGTITPSYYISTSSTLVMFTNINTPMSNFGSTSTNIIINSVSTPKSTIKNISLSDEYSSTTSIPSWFLYNCTSLTSVDLSSMNNITSIGNNFLQGCTALTSLDLSSMTNLTSIGDTFLYNCANLTSLDLSSMNNVTSINNNFLYYCSSLTSVDLSSMTNVTSIGITFLQGCTALTSLDLSSMTNLTSIGGYFLNSSGVTTLKMGAIVPPNLSAALPNSLTSILVPSAAVNAYKSKTYWSAKASIISGY